MARDPAQGPTRLIDVARMTGTSVSTVSNVLNRPHKVGPEMTARVRAAMHELDYVPHEGALRLRRGTSRSIGLVVPTVANPFYAGIGSGAADAAFGHGSTVILCDSADREDREATYLDLLAQQRAAGAVVVPLTADPERLARLRRRGARLVVVDRSVDVDDGCSVAVDDVVGGALAVQHLVEAGCRRIAVVNGPAAVQQCADRWRGAEEAALASSVALRQVVVDPAMTVAFGREAARRILEGGEALPDGIFATNDLIAVGVLQVLQQHRVDVPGSVAVVGYGDLDVADYGPVPLSTVRQPVDLMGHAAVDLLIDEIDRPDRHVHEARVLTPTLVRRESTARG